MLALGDRPFASIHFIPTHELNACVYVFQHLQRFLVSGKAHQPLMERLVQRYQLLDRSAAGLGSRRRYKRFQCFDLFIFSVEHGKLHCAELYHFSKLIQLIYFFRAQVVTEKTLAGDQFQKPFAR